MTTRQVVFFGAAGAIVAALWWRRRSGAPRVKLTLGVATIEEEKQ